jgi:glycogen synthase
MVTTYYPPYHIGGCATYVRALSRALVAQGHEVEVMHCLDAYRLNYKNEPPEEPPDEGIVVHRLKSRFGFLSTLISQQTGHPRLSAPSWLGHSMS